TLLPGEEKTYTFKVYVGPKGYTHLKNLGFNLEESINFGLFSFLGKFVFNVLKYFYKITGNYGWSIVLLTMCLQVFFFPLSIKSFKASMAMKKLQPQIKIIQTKYKEDPKRLNVELMNLYKTSGTNPFGGCLPMLLQIPVFWALFTTLRNAFELRGAPFIFWITDLSMHDPFFVLPILMGAGMLLQQKLTAVSADPNQARMMMFMPVIFTFMFLKFPAGLVLYWFTNSLLTMTGQFIFMKRQKT
ncbi:MAG: YidC/Oxa1 family insertase periplasmic-domain containing protein, partial [bacterium]